LAVFSLLLALAVGLWGMAARNEVARLRTQVAVLEQELESQRTVLVQLSSPQAHTYPISGTEHQPQAQGQLIANAQTGSGVLVVSGLKPLEAGNTYEFWLINDSAAVPAGLFKVDEKGMAVVPVTQPLTPNSFNAIGVSIEPEGGSQQPTGDIVMLGKLNQ
jgi:anti-sigma-K factor RskA